MIASATNASDGAGSDLTPINVIAGPYESLAPVRLRQEQAESLAEALGGFWFRVGWLPETTGRPTHSDLATSVDDGRVEIAGRSLREDAPADRPTLVLPELSLQAAHGVKPFPGRIAAVEMLRRLSEAAGGRPIEVQLLTLPGVDDTAERQGELNAAATEIETALSRAGLHAAVRSARIDPTCAAFWRTLLNRVTSAGLQAPHAARSALDALSEEQILLAADDHDGRQIIELAPTPHALAPTPAPLQTSPTPASAIHRFERNGRSVTFVCEKLAERSGGAERVLIELANALARRGYAIEIVSHEYRGKPPFYELEHGVLHTNLCPPRGALPTGQRLLAKLNDALQPRSNSPALERAAFRTRYAAFHRRLAAHLSATRPDVVVPFMPPAVVATALTRMEDRPRVVASMHNAPEQDFENPVRWDPSKFARRRRLELMDEIDTIGVLLPDYQEWYPEHLRDRTVVIPNAIAPTEGVGAAERGSVILAVGRLADTKRHDLTLRAFAAIADDFDQWQLRIFGVGPLTEEIVALRDELGLQGRAHILGHTSSITEEYLSASVLCHPARFEGFPLAVAESLSAGLPVVGFSDCSGLNSLVRDGENGLLVDPGDGSDDARLQRLTAALRSVLEDPARRSALGAGGPTSVAEYAPDKVVDLWEQILFPASSDID